MAILGPKYQDVEDFYNQIKDDEGVFGWNTYRTGPNKDETRKEFAKRWKDVHHSLNRVWLWPAGKVLTSYTKKHYKGVPDDRHQVILKLWEKAWQDSVTTLYTDYLRNVRALHDGKRESVEVFEKASRAGTGQFMRELNQAHMLIALTDSVQAEFIKILSLKLVKAYFDEFKDSPHFMKHVMYTSMSVNDPAFYYLYVCPESKIIQIKSSTERTCCELQAAHGTGNAINLQLAKSIIDAVISDRKIRKKDTKHLIELYNVFTAASNLKLTPGPQTEEQSRRP